MASTPVSSELILVMDNGVGASGQPLTKNRTYRNLKTTAPDADVYAAAQQLLSLTDVANVAVQRRSISEITPD